MEAFSTHSTSEPLFSMPVSHKTKMLVPELQLVNYKGHAKEDGANSTQNAQCAAWVKVLIWMLK